MTFRVDDGWIWRKADEPGYGDGWRGCERQGVWSVEIVTSTWNGLVVQA